MVITYSKSKGARGQLNRENKYISLSPYAPENLVSRDGFGSPVPRQPAHLHTQAESGAYLRNSSRFPRRRPFIYLIRHTPSDQSRVYRVTQLRTEGVHCCRESAGTGPVKLKVVPVTSAALASHHGPIDMCFLPIHSGHQVRWTYQRYAPLFPTPILVLIGHVESIAVVLY